jgi:hypothetical protein
VWDNWDMRANQGQRRRMLRTAARVKKGRAERLAAGIAGPQQGPDGVLRDTLHEWELKPWAPGGRFSSTLRWRIDQDQFYALMALASVRELLAALEMQLVDGLRSEAVAWDDIGFALNVTGEAARKKHGGRRVQVDPL